MNINPLNMITKLKIQLFSYQKLENTTTLTATNETLDRQFAERRNGFCAIQSHFQLLQGKEGENSVQKIIIPGILNKHLT